MTCPKKFDNDFPVFWGVYSGTTSCSIRAAGVKRSLTRGRMQRHWLRVAAFPEKLWRLLSENTYKSGSKNWRIRSCSYRRPAQVIPMSFETPKFSGKTGSSSPCARHTIMVHLSRSGRFVLQASKTLQIQHDSAAEIGSDVKFGEHQTRVV